MTDEQYRRDSETFTVQEYRDALERLADCQREAARLSHLTEKHEQWCRDNPV